MEKKVTLFSQKELDKLNTETLEFIHREANLYLENLLSISRRIGERTFSLLGIIAASCSFLIAAVSCFSSNREIPVFMLILGFIASVWFLFRAIRGFKSGLSGMAPEDMRNHIRWDETDLHREALLLSVYTVQDRIAMISRLNDRRIARYETGFLIFFATCVIASLFVLLF